jgi:endogenous inhibitor of DNA gyrase (YacG/DUF329 family)
VPAEPRVCPICTTPIPATARRRYCSPACKTAAWRRDNPDRPAGPPRTTAPTPPTTGSQPAATRDCPHCGKPVTIVALLTTPQIAGPQLVTATPDAIPLRPVRTR